jgi:hypothetical protein
VDFAVAWCPRADEPGVMMPIGNKVMVQMRGAAAKLLMRKWSIFENLAWM